MIRLSEIESAKAHIDEYNEYIRLHQAVAHKWADVHIYFCDETIDIPADHRDALRKFAIDLLEKQITDTRNALAEIGIKAD